MFSLLLEGIMMGFAKRLASLRKEKGLTQQEMADRLSIHVTQIKRYESGTNQPALDIFKRIVISLNIDSETLLFSKEERSFEDKNLKMQFEAINKMQPKDQEVIQELIDGMILKYEAKRWSTKRK